MTIYNGLQISNSLKFKRAFLCALVLSSLLLVTRSHAQESATSSATIINNELMSTTSAVFSEAATGTVMSAPTEAVSSPRDARRKQLINSRQRALESFRQERIVNLGANLSNRMDAAVERFFTIITRLESRILKLDATGISVEAATSELRAAATLLSETRALLTDIDAKVFAAATSPSPFSAWQDVRDQYLKIATNIRSVQSTLRNVIALLKEAVVVGVSAPLLPVTDTETATTTPAATL